MIALRNVVKSIGNGPRRRDLLAETNFVFSESRMGLAIGSSEEAEIIMDLLCGNLAPERGAIWRDGRPSWPIGRTGQYRADLTGRITLHFLAAAYNLKFRDCENILFDLVDIHEYYNKAMINWPRNLMLEFSYATALMPTFDIYLVESSISTSNDVFNADFESAFEQRINGKQLIYYSTSGRFLQRFVKKTASLLDGHFCVFEEAEDALRAVELAGPGASQIAPPERASENNFDLNDI